MAADPIYFESGFIMIGSTRIEVEEITINASMDSNPYYSSSDRAPKSIRLGKEKVEFTLKRAFSDNILSKIYDSKCEFLLLLFNNDLDEPQLVMTVEGCKLHQDNIGPINGQDVVKQEVQGQGTQRNVKIDEIKMSIKKECQL